MESVIQIANLFTNKKYSSLDGANNNITTLLGRQTDCAKLFISFGVKGCYKTIFFYLKYPKGKVTWQ